MSSESGSIHFLPREKELSALYGAGKKTSFWSLSDGQIARTEWVRGSVLQPEEPVGIYLQAEGDGKRGGVIVYYEGKDIQTCIEWNKTHGNLAQWKASIAEQKAKPVLATQQEQHPNLPIGYKGDSIADLVSKLEEIDKAAIDEFTKKSEVNKRYAQLRSRPYRFVFDVQANHSALYPSLTKYDAESEQLNVVMSVRAELLGLLHSKHYLVIKLAGDATVSHYLGQNAFGASAKIKKIDTEGFGIALTNGINVDATSNLALLSLAIPMHPQEAKAIKADISYFVDVDLPENNSLTNVLTSSSHSKATINDPTEIVSNYKYIPARLIKVGAFRRSTGEVVGWRAFN